MLKTFKNQSIKLITSYIIFFNCFIKVNLRLHENNLFQLRKKSGGPRSQNKMLTFYPDYIEHATLSLVQTRTKTRSLYICSANYGHDDIFCFILSDLWIGSLIIHGTLLNEDKKGQKENQIHVYTLARKLVFSSPCYTWPGYEIKLKTNTLKPIWQLL